MTYAGLEEFASDDQPHLGGAMKVGDPFTYCPSVWDYMIARFSLSSVLDLGSGCGNAADWFHRRGLRVVAIEGFEPSVRASLYPAVLHDLTIGPVVTRVDFVHCQEVVEHIAEEFVGHVIDSLTNGRICLMTHAVPGQHGYHHVNLKEAGYWIKLMARRDCAVLHEDTRRVRELAARDGAGYMAATGMVFVNRAWS